MVGILAKTGTPVDRTVFVSLEAIEAIHIDWQSGARSGSLQLLLYSVFRIGNATNNITWPSYQDIVSLPDIAWAVPLSLGDSHRGFRVLGTTPDFFARY